MNNYELLEEKIGYVFKNKELILKALTHSSASKTFNYERMEFLGDSLLGFIVAEHLYHNVNKEVGKMSVLRSNLVSTTALSTIVLQNGWDQLIMVGPSIAATGKIAKNILADVFESVTAAIYLDGGINETIKFVNKYVLSDVNSVVNADYKTILQETVASVNISAKLEYKLIESCGPSHSITFKMGLYYNDNLVATAEAGTKKKAEQQCAKMFLENINNNGLNN